MRGIFQRPAYPPAGHLLYPRGGPVLVGRISRNVPGWVLSRPRFPTQARDLFFGVFLILYDTSLMNLYFVHFGGGGEIRTPAPG